MNRARQGCALFLGLFFPLAVALGQYSFTDQNPISSVSGQFLVSSLAAGGSAPRDAGLEADTNLIHLNTALLAVAAERFKSSLWQQLGIPAQDHWSGKIFLRLHPARSGDELVTITAAPFLNRWSYTVELPDRVSALRYARALSGVLLLELANRTAAPEGHSAELPAWLVDGLAGQLLAADGEEILLTAPVGRNGRMGVGRLNRSEHAVDALAGARPILQNLPVLTFDQLSWPTEDQLENRDGGAYFASAQVFQWELLGLKNGREKMRALLAALPAYYNWQTAFYHAFGPDFQGPLDVEKWWALSVANFAAHASGPRWTTDVSLARLDAVLSVPVDYRGSSNALPAHAEISLQSALRNLAPAQRDLVLQTKVRDLTLVEFRLAPSFGNLAEAYRRALADFLGEAATIRRASVANKHGVPVDEQIRLAEALKTLDALDGRRRDLEAHAVIHLTGSSRPGIP